MKFSNLTPDGDIRHSKQHEYPPDNGSFDFFLYPLFIVSFFLPAVFLCFAIDTIYQNTIDFLQKFHKSPFFLTIMSIVALIISELIFRVRIGVGEKYYSLCEMGIGVALCLKSLTLLLQKYPFFAIVGFFAGVLITTTGRKRFDRFYR